MTYESRYYPISTHEMYRSSIEELPNSRVTGLSMRARLHRSSDAGVTWHELPLTLDFWSKIVAGTFTYWPPKFIDELVVTNGALSFTFHDPEDTWERPILPFKLDVESVWRAEYNAGSRKWRVRRVRHLDYDGADRNLREEDAKRLKRIEE
jgi:hypothetical protein